MAFLVDDFMIILHLWAAPAAPPAPTSIIQPQLIVAGTGVMLALIFGSLAVYNARRAYRLSRQIAEAQGTLEKANLQVSVCGEPEVKRLILAAPLSGEVILELRIPFEITNIGRKSANNVLVQFSFSRLLCYGGKGTVQLAFDSKHQAFRGQLLDTRGEIQPILIEASTIQPNLAVDLPLPVSIKEETRARVTVPVTTKDGSKVQLGVRVDFAYKIDIVMLQSDQRPAAESIDLEVINNVAATTDHLIAERYRLIKEKVRFRASGSPEKIILFDVSKEAISEHHPTLPGVRLIDLGQTRVVKGVRFGNALYLTQAKRGFT